MATSVKEQQTKKKHHCSYNKCVYEGKKTESEKSSRRQISRATYKITENTLS